MRDTELCAAPGYSRSGFGMSCISQLEMSCALGASLSMAVVNVHLPISANGVLQEAFVVNNANPSGNSNKTSKLKPFISA